MFLSKNRRTRVVAAALAVALLFPLTTASADYWRGIRKDGTPTGGYFITVSGATLNNGVNYGTIFRSAASNWRAAGSTAVQFALVERGSQLEGVDEYYTQPDAKIANVKPKTLYAVTRAYGYGNTPLIVLRRLTELYPDNRKDSHGNGCYHDVTWVSTTTVLLTDIINLKASAYNIPASQVALNTAVHEIGHTLKLGHSPDANGYQGFDGTESKNDLYRSGETNSIMKQGDNYPFPTVVFAYDKRQLRNKWGQ